MEIIIVFGVLAFGVSLLYAAMWGFKRGQGLAQDNEPIRLPRKKELPTPQPYMLIDPRQLQLPAPTPKPVIRRARRGHSAGVNVAKGMFR
jgi:hypothetical protein